MSLCEFVRKAKFSGWFDRSLLFEAGRGSIRSRNFATVKPCTSKPCELSLLLSPVRAIRGGRGRGLTVTRAFVHYRSLLLLALWGSILERSRFLDRPYTAFIRSITRSAVSREGSFRRCVRRCAGSRGGQRDGCFARG